LLHRVKHKVGREALDSAEEVDKRLSMAVKGYIDASDRVEDPVGTHIGLHGMDMMDASQFEDAERDSVEQESAEHEDADPNGGTPGDGPATRRSRRLRDEPALSDEVVGGHQDAPERRLRWSKEEQQKIEGALQEEDAVWATVEASVPNHPADDVQAFARSNFPVLVAALERRINSEEAARPSRKSVREPEGATHGDTDAQDSEEGGKEETVNDAMEVDVDDLRVTIRYRSGKWTDEENQTLEKALEEEPNWEGVVAKLPERGSEQVRKHAISVFPELMKALEQRDMDSAATSGGNDSVDEDEKAKPMEVEKDDGETETDEDDDKGVKPKQSKPSREKKEEPKSTTTWRRASKMEESKLFEPEEAQAKDKDGKLVEQMPRARLNSGKWSEEEKERLRQALEKEDDMEGVEKFVGTRRFPQIRSFADRTFPELFHALKERIHKAEAEKAAEEENSSSEAGADSRGTDEDESKKQETTQDGNAEEDSKTEGVENKEGDGSEDDVKEDSKDEGRQRKQNHPAVGRGRRATQDLSTNRKRNRNAAKAMDPRTDPPTSSEPATESSQASDGSGDPSSEPEAPAKRKRVNGTSDDAVEEEKEERGDSKESSSSLCASS
jgi:hypothetical protein